ncbi:hypothetical protein [Saccharibacillus alkalitolerans]|uniref:Tim44-like domain-containing protein n=1 Tax=Saccharibacillus alkalitolerans TaxID=2705290 RepID=A0ABX0F2Q1_9BACL|nr:hypothetical protein [Saccharibacillus alkalitolerans]NGZ74852.1 hypothetical protein [Saccharibacillus alkalitolerans]
MSRFNEPDDSRNNGAGSEGRPDWYDALRSEPGRMSTEPSLAQMRRIKEESGMEHTNTQMSTKRKGRIALGSVLAAGVVFGGVWGANSAGWLDGTPNAAQTQIAGQTQNAPGSGGSNAGGAALGGQTDWQSVVAAEKEAESQAREVAETFKREDLTVTNEQLDVFKREFQSRDEDGENMITWIERRHAELSPYAESEFLSVYFKNQAGNLPYEAAISTDSELSIDHVQMTLKELEKQNERVTRITFDYTLDIMFSSGRDPLPMKGTIRMQNGEDGWKVLKDTPQKASYLELYKIAHPELAGDE